jgi:hypothetical protein
MSWHYLPISTIRIARHLRFVILINFFLQKKHYFVFNLLVSFDKTIEHSNKKERDVSKEIKCLVADEELIFD